MIKKLLFAATLLVPGLACAQTPPSASFTDQVDPPSSACNNPAVPHPAQVAGFTQLTYCADYTTDSGINNVFLGAPRNQNWSGFAWLDCYATGNIAGAQAVVSMGGQPTAQCSNGGYTIQNDPATGIRTLDLIALPADGVVNGVSIQSGENCAVAGHSCYQSFPTGNQYAEIKWRWNEGSYMGGGAKDWWSGAWSPGGCIEPDFIEFFGLVNNNVATNTYSTGAYPVNHCGTTTTGQSAQPQITPDANYHVDGNLVTSNSSNPIVWSMCEYHDGVASQIIAGTSTHGCAVGIIPNGTTQQMGPWILSNEASDLIPVTSPVPLYIQWIRLWGNPSCYDPSGNQFTKTTTCSTASPYYTAP